jgi:hypothetical protein
MEIKISLAVRTVVIVTTEFLYGDKAHTAISLSHWAETDRDISSCCTLGGCDKSNTEIMASTTAGLAN